MHLFFNVWMNQLGRAAPIGARQGFSGTEQSTDQRAFFIHRAALWAEVHTVELIESRFLFGGSLAWQARHFFTGSGYRSAAIVATRHALERGNLPPQIADFLTVAAH